MLQNNGPGAGRPGRWRRFHAFGALGAGVVALGVSAPATSAGQPPPARRETAQTDSLARIDAEYEQQRERIDRERIERLARLAAMQKGGEAELTYLEIFRFAVASDRYVAAEPAAERVIRSGTTSQESAILAQLVNIIAEAERGDYDASFRDLKAYAGTRGPGSPSIPARTLLTIGEAYFRRLVQGRKFDLARDVCDLIVEKAEEPAIREHFATYRRRLDLVGRPAPAIRGTDVDGDDVGLGLEPFRGKVVLVVFWASWCNPCVERIPMMSRALELYEKNGFAILGVNLDSGADRTSIVRRYVVEFGLPWPSVLSGDSARDLAAPYAVTEIPANVLIGRDGKVVTFDLRGPDLLRAVAQAVEPSNPPREASDKK